MLHESFVLKLWAFALFSLCVCLAEIRGGKKIFEFQVDNDKNCQIELILKRVERS